MTPRFRWWVWDPINELEAEGRGSSAETAEAAAEEYAQWDYDHNQGDLYVYGHPLLVRSTSDRKVYECSVRIELLPSFSTHISRT